MSKRVYLKLFIQHITNIINRIVLVQLINFKDVTEKFIKTLLTFQIKEILSKIYTYIFTIIKLRIRQKKNYITYY